MTLRGHPVRQVGAFAAWIAAVAAVMDLVVFRLSMGPWTADLLQVGGYGLGLAPVIIWAREILDTLPVSRGQLAIGAALVLAAVVYAAADDLYAALPGRVLALAATGFGEELFFRGFIWDRLGRAGVRGLRLVAVVDVLFAAWHLIPVAAGEMSPGALIGVLVWGLAFGLLRLWSRTTGLPALVHWAVDLSGH